jgi:NAD(P)-dependent dehydrogenase (short-subunit alcohol dehydrogenase family)
MQKKALVLGAGGFIGGHLVNRLKADGFWVRGVDLKENEYDNGNADEFIVGDLRDPEITAEVITDDMDEIYQLAADMGGAGFVFTGENDAAIMHNSALINLNVLEEAKKKGVKKYFILLLLVCILNITSLILIIQNVLKTLLILQRRIVNMVGKNCSVRDYILPIIAIME